MSIVRKGVFEAGDKTESLSTIQHTNSGAQAKDGYNKTVTINSSTGWKLIESSVSGKPADLNRDRLFGGLGPSSDSLYLAVKVSRVKSRHSSTFSVSSDRRTNSAPKIRFHVPPALEDVCVCLGDEKEPHGHELLARDINSGAIGGSTSVRLGKKISPPLGLCDQLFAASTLDSVPKPQYSSFSPSFDLPADDLPSFVFPAGGARLLHTKGRNAPVPSFFHFSFTGIDGSKTYASALMFHERINDRAAEEVLIQFNGVWDPADDENWNGNIGLHDARSPAGLDVRVDGNARIVPNEPSEELMRTPSRTDADEGACDDAKKVDSRSNLAPLFGSASSSPVVDVNAVLKTDRLYAPKVLVVLSNYPLFRALSAFLSQIYQISLSSGPAPIERQVSTFIQHTPLPPVASSSAYHLYLDMLLTTESTEVLKRSSALFPVIIPPIPLPSSSLPFLDLDFSSLFRALSDENILRVFLILLREGKVLLLSSCGALLTEAAEIFRALLFPLDWQCCYIPRLPEALIGALEAPGGFLIGLLTSSYSSEEAVARTHMGMIGEGGALDGLIRRQLAEGVCVVALDYDTVLMGEIKEDALADTISKTVDTPSGDFVNKSKDSDMLGRESYLAMTGGSVICDDAAAAAAAAARTNLHGEGSPSTPVPINISMSTPISIKSAQRKELILDQVVFNDVGPKPPKKVVQKLMNRLKALRLEAKQVLGLSSLPLNREDRNNYSSAYSFAPPPAYIDDYVIGGVEEDEDGDSTEGIHGAEIDSSGSKLGEKPGNNLGTNHKAQFRLRRRVDEISESIRDAFIRFMCHPHILGVYAAFISNTSESDIAQLDEHRLAVTLASPGAGTPISEGTNADGGFFDDEKQSPLVLHNEDMDAGKRRRVRRGL